ncbi:hypothetical protein O181_000416 [Austropuccinia psidii MF-1]|uniref:Uncharacterized protein n=1 Tax=Austropuccinia psidii MF-1 TaxID=1389203 RepID=A0A9Q3B910_9BASI|nr:hypothetical protein [Austropuccinia psidii MF-1]
MSQSDTLQSPYGNHQRSESQQGFQTPGGEGSQDKGESSHYPIHRRTIEPYIAYSNSFRLKRTKPTRLSVASHHSSTRISVAKSHHSSQYQVVSRRRQQSTGRQ